jgi:hypothetical protein
MPEAKTSLVTLVVQFEVATGSHSVALEIAEEQLAPALVLTQEHADVKSATVLQSSVT